MNRSISKSHSKILKMGSLLLVLIMTVVMLLSTMPAKAEGETIPDSAREGIGGVIESAGDGVSTRDAGGSGGVIGGGGGPGGNGYEFRWWSYDNVARNGNAYQLMYNWTGWSEGAGNSRITLNEKFMGANGACTIAIRDGINNHGGVAADYRIVMVGTFMGDNIGGSPGKFPYTGIPPAGGLRQGLDNTWPSLQNNLNAEASDRPAYLAYTKNLANVATQPLTTQACVVLKRDQPETSYTLNIATDKINAFPKFGTTDPVSDRITSSSTGSKSENLNAVTTLNYDGSAFGIANQTSAKTKAIANRGVSTSAEFTPSDLGMTYWQPGKYWFNVNVAKQGSMAAAVSLNGANDPRESWVADGLNLTVPTVAQNTFPEPGGKDTVNDKITLIDEDLLTVPESLTLDGEVVLNWDAYPASTTAQKSSTKAMTFKMGDNTSPNFAPSDFGWDTWAQGRYWFDVKIPKQGPMNDAVDTVDRDADETWNAPPTPPVKILEVDGEQIASDGTVSAGMTFNARISAFGGGSENSGMKFTDTNHTTDVWLGAVDRDDPSGIYVLGPNGQRFNSANTVETVGNTKVATAEVQNLTTPGIYTMVVPTTTFPTGDDYTIDDDSNVCWNLGEAVTCQDGNSESIDKVTPDPDKVWVLDKDGALVAQDHDWTNDVAADGKVFLHGDKVGAVVNGRFPAKLATNLKQYSITDDWTDAAKYVDFNFPELVEVYVGGVNRTTEFDVTIDGTTTTAVAKDSVLKDTAKLPFDIPVKLIIMGEFKPVTPETDTEGATIVLHNSGHETWNNEKKPTNKPPVYIWNPKPDKDVIGSAGQGGDQNSINGQMVFPGQLIEYKVDIDVRVPGNTAYEFETFQVQDDYDENFVPNKNTVEFYDIRDLKIIPRTQYTLTWDDEAHSFTADFNKSWIDANLNANNPGWLIMRFDGRVKDTVSPGTVIENQAFEIINNSKTPTPKPVVTVPPTTPDKEDLRCDYDATSGEAKDCVDIDKKVVVKGDKIDYRLTMDARPARGDAPGLLAYDVHKLGMIDTFDAEYLSLEASDIKVARKDTGAIVTDQFNIQVTDNKAYIFAKQVDSVNNNGTAIPGDPQPADLADYAVSPINPLTTPIINQDLLGHEYYIYLRTTVEKEKNGYVIENVAEQNFENMSTITKVVSNPLQELKPEKDVAVEVGGESINKGEVPMKGMFNYLLKSSLIPADRAHPSSSWYIVDDYNEAADRYTGQWVVQTQTDLYDGETLIAKAGDTLDEMKLTGESDEDGAQSGQDGAQSGGEESDGSSSTGMFTVEDEDGVLTVTAGQEYIDLINTRLDLEQGWQIYVQFERIQPGTIKNVFTEYYNNVPRPPEEVETKTPENPAISIVKYDSESGIEDGDRNDPADALTIEHKGEVKINFLITNTGDVPLVNVKLTDVTTSGSGTVKDITCPASLTEKGLDVGESVTCSGILTGVKPGETHTNNATVEGESIYTGEKVTDEDPWNGKIATLEAPGNATPEKPKPPIAETGASSVALFAGLGTAMLAAGAGILADRRRRGKMLEVTNSQ